MQYTKYTNVYIYISMYIHMLCLKRYGASLRFRIAGVPGCCQDGESQRLTQLEARGGPGVTGAPQNYGKNMGKPGENHGKTMGKTWENHGKSMGKPWENGG